MNRNLDLQGLMQKGKSDPKKKKHCLIYMNTPGKLHWELFVTVLLVFVCVFIPLRLSLNLDVHAIDEVTGVTDPFAFTEWEIFFYACDCLFLLDLGLQFFMTNNSQTGNEEDDRCKIAKMYLTGWFIIDLVSILPFNMIMIFF